jgi:hypothetical protein
MKQDIFFNTSVYKSDIKETFWDLHIQRVTEISTLILTSNRTRHDGQFFYVSFFPNRQFCFRAAGRNLVNYRSRNRPETHALPA